MKKIVLTALLIAGHFLSFSQQNETGKLKEKTMGELLFSAEGGWSLRAPTEIDGEDHRVFMPYGRFEYGPTVTYKRHRIGKKMWYGASLLYDVQNNELFARGFVGAFYFRFGGKLGTDETEAAIGIRPKLYQYKFATLLGFIEVEKVQTAINGGVTIECDIFALKNNKIEEEEE